ncbi:hydroxylamine reductase [Spirochaeta thermophila DSM 6192]|uniref:Hydroxylamine reductase n=2 Tax=Winmispira thermophila TaxID=154 RepID=E0RQH4_WINT6|nr:hydroxylamine reductase [Spirochaeta thermophila DSM 6192]
MFCFQCQEAARGTGCEIRGVCGKTGEVSNLQDTLVHVLKGLAFYHRTAMEAGIDDREAERIIIEGLFTTVTNVNFDPDDFVRRIQEALQVRESLRKRLHEAGVQMKEPDFARWHEGGPADWKREGYKLGPRRTEDPDVRSLKELLLYGLKGMAAYTHHAAVLGYRDERIISFIDEALIATEDTTRSAGELIDLVMECGRTGVLAMELLDKANTSTYGNPEVSTVNLGVRNRPGILVSGHDLKDLEDLLEQTKDAGIDIYTHGEMLPAHYYPFFKKYPHFAGNYGNAWWKQVEEFEAFGGPILMTTNCLVPPPANASYLSRLYTTGPVRYPGAHHIPERTPGARKDFSRLIEHAKTCPPPAQLEEGTIVGGFAHHQVAAVAEKVLEAIKAGKITRFVVMAGCDGRFPSRAYYTEFAQRLPRDTVILTAGCAKYRYHKLPLGEIDGIPRILDAGQCNDSYSLIKTALTLKEALGVASVNDLPIVYNIAWYEQKAVIVLLALLALGVKRIHLGPTLPAFLSEGVRDVLIREFEIGTIDTVGDDLDRMLAAAMA